MKIINSLEIVYDIAGLKFIEILLMRFVGMESRSHQDVTMFSIENTYS